MTATNDDILAKLDEILTVLKLPYSRIPKEEINTAMQSIKMQE